MQQFPVARNRLRAGDFVRAVDVRTRDFVAVDRHDALAGHGLDMLAGNADEQRFDPLPSHAFGIPERLRNRAGRFFDVRNHAASESRCARRSDAEHPEHRSARQLASHLCDDGGGVRGADVECSNETVRTHGSRAMTRLRNRRSSSAARM